MAAVGVNTQYDIGIRRSIKNGTTSLGERNFEPEMCLAGTIQYQSNFSGQSVDSGGTLRIGLLWVDGSWYATGQALPYDVGGVSYSVKAVALLLAWWEQIWVNPTS